MSVVCGNCTRNLGRCLGSQVRHETVEEVRECYDKHYIYIHVADVNGELGLDYIEDYEYDADAAYERHLENRDWAEQAAFADYEDRLGKISYEDARDLQASI